MIIYSSAFHILHFQSQPYLILPPPPSPLYTLKYLEYLYLNSYINLLLIKVPLLFNIYYTFKKNLLQYLIS
jgi:hypothetical protein